MPLGFLDLGMLREPGSITFNQDGTETAQAGDLRPGADGAGSRAAHPAKIFVKKRRPQPIGG